MDSDDSMKWWILYSELEATILIARQDGGLFTHHRIVPTAYTLCFSDIAI